VRKIIEKNMDDYFMSVRAVRNGEFVADIGPTKFLIIPAGQTPSPSQTISATAWYKAVRTAAAWTNEQGEPRGDILFIVHGYDMSESEVIQRHRRLKDDLLGLGFKGVVVSFDWPSDDRTLAYIADRHRAKRTAFHLVSDGIAYLSVQQTPSCTINVHVLGHSTGAYVIREAFDDADDTGLENSGWTISQLFLAAGDISSGSMSSGSSSADSIYRHCVRLTNYFNRMDEALDLSNIKRLGIAPRVGRVGLPSGSPVKAVDIDCTAYYLALAQSNSTMAASDEPHGFFGLKCHSWYFGNLVFTRDLFMALIGVDRTIIPTRIVDQDGRIALKHS
jgi:hypothetical protein